MTEAVRQWTVLIVDDTPGNIDVLRALLKSDYQVKVATNGRTALEIAASKDPPDLILLDVMMPEMDGFEVCRRLKENPATRGIPVVFVTARGDAESEEKGFALGGLDYVTKPISPPTVRSRVRTHLALADQNRTLDQKVRERTQEVEATRLELIRRLGRAAEFKDNETGMHVIRMSTYCRVIALAAGLPEDEADLILHAAPLHDVGKIGIPDRILLKPGKLDPDEWTIMMTHAQIGHDIIGQHDSPLLQAAATAALTHHEKWNGTGYPRKLAGQDIPLIGRISAIADVFDALTSERPYKAAWPVDKALDEIRTQRGQHFDPALVDAFLSSIPNILEVKESWKG